MRGDVRRFGLSKPAARLSVACKVLAPLTDLVHSVLPLSSAEWRKRNKIAAARGGVKCFRILEALEGVEERKFAQDVLTLFHPDPSGWGAVPEDAVNTETIALASRVCRTPSRRCTSWW